MNTIRRCAAPLLAVLALLTAGIPPAQAGVVTHLLPIGLTPLSLPLTALAVRLPAGNDFAYVGGGFVDGPCVGQADCLLADRGWLAMPTADDHIAAATGPALTNRNVTSWTALQFSADPVLSPLLDLDLVLFTTGQRLLGGYRWEVGYDSSVGYYRLLQASTTQWAPAWNEIFAVPLPGTLPLALAALTALALLNFRPRLRACR